MRSTLPPFLIALLIAVVTEPLLRKLEDRGWPRRRAVPLLYLLIILGVIAALVWCIPILLEQVSNIITNFSLYLDQAQRHLDLVMKAPGLRRIPPNIREPIQLQISHAASYVPIALSRVTDLFLGAVSSVLWIVITLLATFYLLLDLPKIGVIILRWISYRHRESVRSVASEVGRVFAGYVRGLFIVCLLYGTSVTVVLTLLGLPNALALGVLGATLYMVPYLGAAVTVLVSGLIGLISAGASKALIVVIGLLIVNQTFDYILAPRILGEHVGLHPLASLFAMVTAGTLFGVAGVILAVPIAASIVVVLEHLYPKLLAPSATVGDSGTIPTTHPIEPP